MGTAIYKPAVDTKESFVAETEEVFEADVEKKPKPAFEPHPCPICREKFQDPVTGEMKYGPETMAGIKEVEDMLAGKIPNTLKSFNSFEEMLADLNSDDDYRTGTHSDLEI